MIVRYDGGDGIAKEIENGTAYALDNAVFNNCSFILRERNLSSKEIPRLTEIVRS